MNNIGFTNVPFVLLAVLLLLILGSARHQVLAADGTIPNSAHPASELYQRISPPMGNRHMNQPTVVNGYLFLAGNAVHEIWDISDPYNPVKVSELFSPDRFGEAESHQVSFARYPNGSGYSLYAATTSGKGIDLWDISDAAAPVLTSSIHLEGVNYGDNTEAVWGIHWQGDYIYVGGTNTGLHIVDASDPHHPTLVKRLPNSAFGGMSAGPVFAVGNVLIITTPKNSSAIATMDISDPANPMLLDFKDPPRSSYLGGYLGGKAFLQNPFKTYDVMSEPDNITLLGSDETAPSEYMSFDNGLLFLGSLQTSDGGIGGILKYDISDPNNLVELAHIKGRDDPDTDDQFSVPVGNLLVVSDDEKLAGAWIAVHDTQADTSAPKLLNVNPSNGATNRAITARIALSFSDQIEITSVNESSFIVRPAGGQPLMGKWGYEHTIVTFWPDQPLEADTTYEIILPTDGITDLVGNGLEEEYRSTFSTGNTSNFNICDIAPVTPVQVGQSASFAAEKANPGIYVYTWEFGDMSIGSGQLTSHTYTEVGRYQVILTVSGSGDAATDLPFESENATLGGGVVIASSHSGYYGTGYVDYPSVRGSGVKTSWSVNVNSTGNHDIRIRYSNGGDSTRILNLVVNGSHVQTVNFEPLANWDTWGEITASGVPLVSGNNTVQLVADAGTVGPNLDRITIIVPAGNKDASCSVMQVVHRPLMADRPSHSNAVLVTENMGKVWVVNPDTSTVTAVNINNLSKAFEVQVGIKPSSLAEAPNGDIWVVNQESATISILDAGSGDKLGTIDLPRASRPFGIAFSPDGGAAYVTLEALGNLLEINPVSRVITGRVDFGPDANGIIPKVRGVAVSADSSRALVTRFISPDGKGMIYDVDAANLILHSTYNLGNNPGPDTPDSGRGIPNYLNSVTISPDGVKAWIPSKQDNMDRGQFRDTLPLTQDSTVRPIVSQLDLNTNQEELTSRIDLNDADFPFAAAVSLFGDLVFVSLQGTDSVDVRDAYSGETVAGFTTGAAPQGLALDSSGRLYVQNFLDRSLSVFDVSTILDGSDNTAQLLATVPLIDNELLAPLVLQGKKIFYNAHDRRMSRDGYLSCASCHLDGGQDGRVWDFTDRGEGFRNTISLRGRGGMAHGPVHWTGNFDEIHDFENDIRNHFGGTGFMTDADFNITSDPLGEPKAGFSLDLDALAAYVASLDSVLSSPFRHSDGQLTAEGKAGKSIFNSLNCASCHTGLQKTDSTLNVLHDVNTIQLHSGKRIGMPLTGFDTPTLLGIWFTPPYLHDGSAATLYNVINNPEHGDASGLDQVDKDALVAYLLQLDGTDLPGDGGGNANSNTVVVLMAYLMQLKGTHLPEHGGSDGGGSSATSQTANGDASISSTPNDGFTGDAGKDSEMATVSVTDIDSVGVPAYIQDSSTIGLVSIEAEADGGRTVQGGYAWIDSTAVGGYSGSAALLANPNSGSNMDSGYSGYSPRVDYRVYFNRPGTHHVWIRGYGETNDDNSVHVGLDGAEVESAYHLTGFGRSWTWSKATMDGGAATIHVPSAGVHIVNIWMREDGTRIDKLVLTSDSAYTPDGKGPATSNWDFVMLPQP